MRGMMGTRGITVGKRGIKVRMRGMGWECWECGECGESGWECGNRGGNAGNQCDSLWESSCLLLRLKSQSGRGAFHHSAFMGSCPTISHTYFVLFYQVDEFSFKEIRTCLCLQHVHSRLAIHSMICCSAYFFVARNCSNKQSRRLVGTLGFQRKNLRWTSCKTRTRNTCSFKQFCSRLSGLSKVAG